MERRVVGFGLIVAGALFFLERLSLITLQFSFWSIGWVLLGGYLIYRSVRWGRRRWATLAFGSWMAAVGALDILAGMGLSHVNGGIVRPLFWPLLLLGVGIAILTGGVKFGFIVDGREWRTHGKKWGVVGDSRIGGPGFVVDEDLVLNHGLGECRIDLSQADVAPGIWNVTMEQGIGDATIRLPANVSVRVEANVGLGDLEVLGDQRGGITPSIKREVIVPDADATLVVRAQLGIGRLRIMQAAPFGDARRDGRTIRSIVDLEMEG